MTTLNVNAVEMVNNSVESNNTIMGNIEELTKVFEQEERVKKGWFPKNPKRTYKF